MNTDRQEQKTLKELRKQEGLMQYAVAQRLNISVKTLQNWESGICLPSALNLKHLAEMYNCSMDDIFLPQVLAKSEIQTG